MQMEISGSSTSTGSFGMVHAEGIKGLDGTYDGTLLIPGQLAFGADTDSMLRRRTSNDVEFRMAGSDIVRINPSGLQVENGNLEVESGNVIASGNISGSSTSTGSFGTIQLNDNVILDEVGGNFYFARKGDQPFGGGSGNIALGNDVLGDQGPTTGDGNFAAGDRTLRYLTSGDHNIAIGGSAFNFVTDHDHNIGIGQMQVMRLKVNIIYF